MKIKSIFKILVCILLIAVASLSFFACKGDDDDNAINITICVPDGAPALSIAKLLYENKQFDGGVNLTYKIATGGATDISGKFISGQCDMAIVPTNLASTLNAKIDAKAITINALGQIYMVGKNQTTLNGLKGKVVYNIGQGGTPDITFKYILTQAGIPYQESDVADANKEKVSLTYVSSGSELIPLLKTGKAEYGILGEPAVTKAVGVADVEVVFDMQQLWKEASMQNGYGYPQTCLIISKKLQNVRYNAFLNSFVEELRLNYDWISENPQTAGEVLKNAGSMVISETLSADTIFKCNLVTKLAYDEKYYIYHYLSTLFNFNPSCIGGKLPNDDFYFKIK